MSFDPEHDTPERLRAYGEQYIGSDAKAAFAHWDFAVPDKPVLLEMAKFFDVGITMRADRNNHAHSFDDADWAGRQSDCSFYPGNDWTPEQVLADVKQSAGTA